MLSIHKKRKVPVSITDPDNGLEAAIFSQIPRREIKVFVRRHHIGKDINGKFVDKATPYNVLEASQASVVDRQKNAAAGTESRLASGNRKGWKARLQALGDVDYVGYGITAGVAAGCFGFLAGGSIEGLISVMGPTKTGLAGVSTMLLHGIAHGIKWGLLGGVLAFMMAVLAGGIPQLLFGDHASTKEYFSKSWQSLRSRLQERKSGAAKVDIGNPVVQNYLEASLKSFLKDAEAKAGRTLNSEERAQLTKVYVRTIAGK